MIIAQHCSTADLEEQKAWLCTTAPLLLHVEKEMEDEVAQQRSATPTLRNTFPTFALLYFLSIWRGEARRQNMIHRYNLMISAKHKSSPLSDSPCLRTKSLALHHSTAPSPCGAIISHNTHL